MMVCMFSTGATVSQVDLKERTATNLYHTAPFCLCKEIYLELQRSEHLLTICLWVAHFPPDTMQILRCESGDSGPRERVVPVLKTFIFVLYSLRAFRQLGQDNSLKPAKYFFYLFIYFLQRDATQYLVAHQMSSHCVALHLGPCYPDGSAVE